METAVRLTAGRKKHTLANTTGHGRGVKRRRGATDIGKDEPQDEVAGGTKKGRIGIEIEMTKADGERVPRKVLCNVSRTRTSVTGVNGIGNTCNAQVESSGAE